jgi:hypothetical protein
MGGRRHQIELLSSVPMLANRSTACFSPVLIEYEAIASLDPLLTEGESAGS